MRRYRARRRLGLMLAQIEIDVDTLEMLITSGRLTREEADDRYLLAQRLGEILEGYVFSVTT